MTIDETIWLLSSNTMTIDKTIWLFMKQYDFWWNNMIVHEIVIL
jgi:hypothetical protein